MSTNLGKFTKELVLKYEFMKFDATLTGMEEKLVKLIPSATHVENSDSYEFIEY